MTSIRSTRDMTRRVLVRIATAMC